MFIAPIALKNFEPIMGDGMFRSPELAFYYPPTFYKHYAATRLNQMITSNQNER
jgi:hypothetical protein